MCWEAFIFVSFTTAVCVKHVLRSIHFRIASDDNGAMLFVACQSAEDAARLHGHCYKWWGENVFFCHVNRLSLFQYNPEDIICMVCLLQGLVLCSSMIGLSCVIMYGL
uniref:Uncharacterized protein n=1 Tax=Arundo donax TaxID=35708 RepID=A0A0A8ZNR4_ARUDO